MWWALSCDKKMSEQVKWRELPVTTRRVAYAALGLMGFLIWDQQYWWGLQDEYAFGYIVPLFVAYVLYERWPRIGGSLIGAERGRVGWGLDVGWVGVVLTVIAVCMLLGGLLSFLLGAVYRSLEGNNLVTSNLLAFGFGNMLLGGVYLYADQRADGTRIPVGERLGLALLFLFPAVIWMLSVPMFTAVYSQISLFLMNKVAVVVYHTFDVLGYAIVREGSVLQLPLGDVGVEDACSGIRSLTACLFAGSFLGAVYFTAFWKKLFLVGTAMFFAFFNNILRSLFLTAWAYAYGPTGLDGHVMLFGMDLGNVHDFTGWVVLGLTVVCLLVLVKLFSIEWETPVPAEAKN